MKSRARHATGAALAFIVCSIAFFGTPAARADDDRMLALLPVSRLDELARALRVELAGRPVTLVVRPAPAALD